MQKKIAQINLSCKLPSMGKILAIDYGLSRVGTALTDYGKCMAFPFKVIRFKNDDLLVKDVRSIVEEEDVEMIIIGVPLHLSADISPMVEKVMIFKGKLESELKIKIDTVDERLTSQRAKSMMHEFKLSPSKNKDRLNCMAASVILESYLDKLRLSEDF